MDEFYDALCNSPDVYDSGGIGGDDPRRNFWGKFWAIILGGYCF